MKDYSIFTKKHIPIIHFSKLQQNDEKINSHSEKRFHYPLHSS